MAEAPELSVLVPSHKRPEVLARTLEHLALQEGPPATEVIVSIDGDHDHGPARLEEFKTTAPFELVVLRQPHMGHGAVLNRALNLARGRYTLVIGDDIFGAPDFTRRHVRRLRELNRPQVAVQGLTKWHPDLLPDDFLEWEARSGAIFAFPRMQPYSFVSAEYLFTSNVSFTTEWLQSTRGFPEDVAWDMDTVFAFRALDQGLELYYDPDAVAYHYHTWSVDTEAVRRYVHGLVAARLSQEDDRFRTFVTHPRMTPWRKVRYGASRLVRPVAERTGPLGLKGWCWIHELNYQFARGYAAYRQGEDAADTFRRS